VVGCAVNVLCHLVCSSSAPSSYLPLAPPLFSLLTQSSNTWLVIKLVKLFGVLAPLEPRLAAKLAGPLMAILRHTPAKSLAYECVCTAIAALPDHPELTALCAHKLHEFIQDADPNLRYLGKGIIPPMLFSGVCHETGQSTETAKKQVTSVSRSPLSVLAWLDLAAMC
jgi:AP-3 complex subunit delta-1